MKVRLVLSIEVDPAKWNTANGTGTAAKDVSADVQRYYLNTCQGANMTDECGTTVTQTR
jgi:hypothetical protein